jgi:uncharacterized protein
MKVLADSRIESEPVPKQEQSLQSNSPYAFVLLIGGVFVSVSLFAGLISVFLQYPVLAIIAIFLITRKRWWRKIGFTYPGKKGRSLVLFVPMFLPILWWPLIAPLIGYGTFQIPASATLSFYLGFTLLIGFVEEAFFRGMMLQPLKSEEPWRATLVTAFLFGAVHVHFSDTHFSAFSLYTVMQVGYAFAFGLSAAALVLVTGLIWPVILAHFLTDFSPYLNTAGGVASTTITQTDYAITSLVIVVYTTWAVILLVRTQREL